MPSRPPEMKNGREEHFTCEVFNSSSAISPSLSSRSFSFFTRPKKGVTRSSWRRASIFTPQLSFLIEDSFSEKSRISWGGTSRSCCRTGQQNLSTRLVQRIGRKVGRSSTMASALSAMKRETENSSDDSLEAAVKAIEFTGVHHVGMLCESVERSLKFYCDVLGLEINPTRPDDKLSFGGVWLNVGSPSQMIHLMELPNPDPKEGRPQHGGRDRHACIAVKDVMKIKEVFDKAGVPYTSSGESGSLAIFVRDPDGNALEFSKLQ